MKKTAVQLAIQQLVSAYNNITQAASLERDEYNRARLNALAQWVGRCRYDAEEIDTDQKRRFGKGAA